MAAPSYYDNSTHEILDGTVAKASDVEDKCDDIAVSMADVAADMDNTVRFTNVDFTDQTLTASVAERTLTVMGFDSSGDVTLYPWAEGDILSACQVAQTAAQAAQVAAEAAADEAEAFAITAVNGPSASGTSTTSASLGVGDKSFTIQTGRYFIAGQWVAATASGGQMIGVISSYDSGTGALVIDSRYYSGSGTYGSWSIGISGALAFGEYQSDYGLITSSATSSSDYGSLA